AHSLAAATVGWATLLIVGRRGHSWVPHAGLGLTLLAGGILLRSEAVLFGIALALGLVARAAVERRRRDGVLAVGVLTTTVAAYMLEALLEASVVTGTEATPFT